MAAPTFIEASAGVTITTGVGTPTIASGSSWTAGDVVVLHVLQDGTSTAPSLAGTANISNLAGTTDTMTVIGPGAYPVGSPTAGNQFLWIGRAVSSASAISADVSTAGDDCYMRLYVFRDVNTGTALADVIENSSAGNAPSTPLTQAAVNDRAVITLGSDRLALNLVAINDDNAMGAFTGMTGGTWAEPTAEFADPTGTDGCIQLQTATIASAGTIDGGSFTMAASDGWSVVGTALIPASAAAPTSYPPFRQLIASNYLR